MLETFLLVVFLVVAAMAWQHLRYLRIRRDSAQDRQLLLHSADVFHVIVFFKLGNGDKVVDTVRRFVQQILCHQQGPADLRGAGCFHHQLKTVGELATGMAC